MAAGDFASLTPVVPGAVPSSWARDVRDSVVLRFASAASRDATLTGLGASHEGMVAYLKDVNQFTVWNGSVWVPFYCPTSAVVATSQTTTSTTFADMATVGPAVTVTTGTSALVTLSGKLKCSAADGVLMGCAVSGASTVAAAATQALTMVGTSEIGSSFTYLLTGLTSGSNIFTAKYRIAFSGTMTAADRGIIVVPLP